MPQAKKSTKTKKASAKKTTKKATKAKSKKRFAKKQNNHDELYIDHTHIIAASSYLWIFFVIPLIWGHNKPFVLHHAKQGGILFALQILALFFLFIPILGWFVSAVLWVFVISMSIIGIFMALSNELWQMPFSEKIIETVSSHIK